MLRPLPIPAVFAVAIGALTALPAFAQQAGSGAAWQTRCAGPSRAADTLNCEASQTLRMKDGGQILFKIDIVYRANAEQPMLQMQAPLGFYLPGGVRLSVDGAPLGELNVATCDKRGCFLSAPAGSLIAPMMAGNQLEIEFSPAADKRQTIPVPLAGFDRAIAAVQ